jgi:hypothetical protein
LCGGECIDDDGPQNFSSLDTLYMRRCRGSVDLLNLDTYWSRLLFVNTPYELMFCAIFVCLA